MPFSTDTGLGIGREPSRRAAGASGEDETDNITVVVRTGILKTCRAAVVQGWLLKIEGVLEGEASVMHVIAGHVEDLSTYLEGFP